MHTPGPRAHLNGELAWCNPARELTAALFAAGVLRRGRLCFCRYVIHISTRNITISAMPTTAMATSTRGQSSL